MPSVGKGPPVTPPVPAPPPAAGAHHLAQLRLQVCLLHAQLLVGLDHLVQLLLTLLALLQLQGRGGGQHTAWGPPVIPGAPGPAHLVLELVELLLQ